MARKTVTTNSSLADIITVRNIIAFLTVISIVVSCVPPSSKLTSIQLAKVIPVINSEQQLVVIEDSLYINYWENLVLCQIPYSHLNIKNRELLSQDLNYMSLIYEVNSKRGYLYYHCDADSIKYGYEINADSLYKVHVFGGKLNTIKDSLRLVNSRTQGLKLTETYLPKQEYKTPFMFDSMYVVYDQKYRDVSFSFSDRMDSLYNSKMTGYQLVFNEKFSEDYNLLFPKRYASYKIKKIVQKKYKDIILFMKAYKEFKSN